MQFRKVGDLGSSIYSCVVLGILEDLENHLWVSSYSGIFRLDLIKNQTILYGPEFGVHTDSAGDFPSSYRDGQGSLYFGNASGFYVIHPDEIKIDSSAPKVIITDFQIGEKSIKPAPNGILTIPIEETTKISLPYNENTFSIQFAGLSFRNPDQNHHLYMLENFDQGWIEGGSEKVAHYYKVPAGSYIFHVRATNSDGVWGERYLKITILPPWWRTWWAYSIYGALLAMGIFAFDRIQRNRIIRREQERTRLKEIEHGREIEKAYRDLKTTQTQLVQSEKMASLGELTAGIAHEIQNPLNFVNNFSEINKELLKEMNDELAEGNVKAAMAIANTINQNEEKINHHGRRADSIVKSMLQHSRVAPGQKEPTDINALADEYLRLSYHGLRAKDKSFTAKVETSFDQNLPKITVVAQDIGRVMLNLFTNAFYSVMSKKKATKGDFQPTIFVGTSTRNGQLEIKVKDNGVGIPPDILEKIFNPFFTTKPGGEGTGLGLSLSYDIITKGHNGRIEVNTREGEFAEFIVHLPIHANQTI
jgi:signal transduction histidine kinase